MYQIHRKDHLSQVLHPVRSIFRGHIHSFFAMHPLQTSKLKLSNILISFDFICLNLTLSCIISFLTRRIGEDGAWNEKPIIVTNSSRATFHIEALQPFTVYSFRVVAINSIGRSKPSKPSYYIVTLREGKF